MIQVQENAKVCVVQIFIQLCAGQKSWTSSQYSFITFYFHRVLPRPGDAPSSYTHTDVDRLECLEIET